MELDKLLKDVIEIAKNAGEKILQFYNSQQPLTVFTKHDDSPVTEADLAAHDLIVKGLKELTPGLPVLSEEDPSFPPEERMGWNFFWLVDPLDGTREFINRSGQFTVNIALIENSKPILGVIFIPLKSTVYYAAKEVGSFKEVVNMGPASLKIKPWREGEDIVLVATRRELHEDFQQLLTSFGNVKITYRSSSLKFCLVAEGNADIYLRKKPIHEWDTGAGQCVLEQAGGVVLDLNWQALRYNTQPHLLNPPFIALGDSKQLLPILKTMPTF